MPPTLGQRLRHARESRQLALMDVAHQTRIPVARIKDLEEDNYTSFGSLTYAKSFLKAYSEMLSVNADEVLSHLQAPSLGGSRDYRYLVEDHGMWVNENSSRPAMIPAQKSSMRAPRSLLLFGLIGSFILIASVGLLLGNHYLQKGAHITADGSAENAETMAKNQLNNEEMDDPFEVSLVQITSILSGAAEPANAPRAVPVFDTPPRPEIVR